VKIPESRQLNDVVPGQNGADKIRLRRGVNFVQMTLRFGLTHKCWMHSSRVPPSPII
jgi:hypothetical protein